MDLCIAPSNYLPRPEGPAEEQYETTLPRDRAASLLRVTVDTAPCSAFARTWSKDLGRLVGVAGGHVTWVTQDSPRPVPNKPPMTPPGPVQVRFATVHDVPYLVEAWGELARFHEQFNPGFALSPRWRRAYTEYIGELLGRDDARVVVAWAADVLAGLAIGRITLLPAFFRHRRRGYIQDVYTRPPYRRRGIARRMVERLEAWLRSEGIERVELTVACRNSEAVAFWEHLGYRPYMEYLSKEL